MTNAGVLDVYFEDEVEILVRDPEPFSVATVRDVLEEQEVEFETIARADGR